MMRDGRKEGERGWRKGRRNKKISERRVRGEKTARENGSKMSGNYYEMQEFSHERGKESLPPAPYSQFEMMFVVYVADSLKPSDDMSENNPRRHKAGREVRREADANSELVKERGRG